MQFQTAYNLFSQCIHITHTQIQNENRVSGEHQIKSNTTIKEEK